MSNTNSALDWNLLDWNKKDTTDILLNYLIENVISDNAPYNFNLLDEQCGHIVENSHTNILMRLLQYQHPQYGYVFLKNFFKHLGISISLTQNDIIFDRERFTEGAEKNGRIDGYICQKDNFALIIENKINHAPPTSEQLATYISDITGKTGKGKEPYFDPKNIWVIYLTLDGNDKPQSSDVEVMIREGICYDKSRDNEYEEIQGDRYFAISYQDDILPWLKDEIQPIIMQRDQTLNTGLLQYINFLEGMFGKRQQDIELLKKSEDWKNKLIEKIKPSENFEEKNRQLSDIISNLKDIQKGLKRDTEKSKYKHYAAGILINLMEEINKEPMRAFFDITYEYFRDILNMKECVVRHRFDYCFIQIRKASWPTNVHFEWYPLGISKLSGSKNLKYRLCFHVEGRDEEYRKNFEQVKYLLNWSELKQNRIYYYKDIEQTKPIINMETEELKVFLHKAYQDITIEIIDEIDKVICSNDQK